MTTYKLPDYLGGHEVERLETGTSGQLTLVRFTHPDRGGLMMRFPFDDLTEVLPPLPPEPPIGTVLTADRVGAWVVIRFSNGVCMALDRRCHQTSKGPS